MLRALPCSFIYYCSSQCFLKAQWTALGGTGRDEKGGVGLGEEPQPSKREQEIGQDLRAPPCPAHQSLSLVPDYKEISPLEL